MGFDRPAVLQALQQTSNDSYAAVNVLVARGGGGSATGPGETGGLPPRQGGAATAMSSDSRGSTFSPSEEANHRHSS